MDRSYEIEFSRATADELVHTALQDGLHKALALALEEVSHARVQRAFLLSEDGQPASTFSALSAWIGALSAWGNIITSAIAFAWVVADDNQNALSSYRAMAEKLSTLASLEASGGYAFMTSTLKAKAYIRRVLGATKLNCATVPPNESPLN